MPTSLAPLSLIVFLLAAACGGSQKPEYTDDGTVVTVEVVEEESPEAEALRADVDRLGELYLRLGAAVEAAGSDCAAIAEGIESWVAEHRSAVQAIQKRLDAAPESQKEPLIPRLEAHLQVAAEKVSAGQKECSGDERVFEAVSQLRL